MSAGIQEWDKGCVNGTTWHGLPQYVTQDKPVTITQAREVMDYPMEKVPLFRHGDTLQSGSEFHVPVAGAHCVIRPDHNVVLVPHVGDQFTVLDNTFILNFVHEHLLAKFKGLEIESVGTLFNGATAFINLKLAEFQIKGDQSPSLSRLMYYNPLGLGSYKAGAHSIRIVCNNTLRAAAGEAAANRTLAKFRHTKSAADRINGHLEELAQVQLGLKEHVEVLDLLAAKPVTATMVRTFLDKLFPTQDSGKPKEGRALSLAVSKQEDMLHTFERGDAMTRATATSAYGLLQATTYYFDHNTIRNGDMAARMWDGLVGERAAKKDTAFKMLVDLAA